MRRRYSPVARWTRRLLGLVGALGVLAVGVLAVTMILSSGDDEVVSAASTASTPTPIPAAGKDAKLARE